MLANVWAHTIGQLKWYMLPKGTNYIMVIEHSYTSIIEYYCNLM